MPLKNSKKNQRLVKNGMNFLMIGEDACESQLSVLNEKEKTNVSQKEISFNDEKF